MKEEHIIIGGIDFTLTEFEVLKLVMRGLPRKEIAAERKVALGTFDTQMLHIYHKTGIRKVTELIAFLKALTRKGIITRGSEAPADDYPFHRQLPGADKDTYKVLMRSPSMRICFSSTYTPRAAISHRPTSPDSPGRAFVFFSDFIPQHIFRTCRVYFSLALPAESHSMPHTIGVLDMPCSWKKACAIGIQLYNRFLYIFILI